LNLPQYPIRTANFVPDNKRGRGEREDSAYQIPKITYNPVAVAAGRDSIAVLHQLATYILLSLDIPLIVSKSAVWCAATWHVPSAFLSLNVNRKVPHMTGQSWCSFYRNSRRRFEGKLSSRQKLWMQEGSIVVEGITDLRSGTG
jgi:hypothetical protein